MPYGQYRQAGQEAEPVIVAGPRGKALLWVDASNPASIISQTGNVVTELADLAGDWTYREDLRAPATGGPDTGTATIGGLNAFDFGFTDCLRTHILSGDPDPIDNFASLRDANSASIAFILSADGSASASGYPMQAGWASDSSTNAQISMTSSSNIVSASFSGNNITGMDVSGTADLFDSPKIFAMTVTLSENNSSGTVLSGIEINGEREDSSIHWDASFGAFGGREFEPGDIILGGRGVNNGFGAVLHTLQQWGGLFGEMVILEGHWPAVEMTGYFAHKWNQLAVLPADHPHKTTPPVLKPFI